MTKKFLITLCSFLFIFSNAQKKYYRGLTESKIKNKLGDNVSAYDNFLLLKKEFEITPWDLLYELELNLKLNKLDDILFKIGQNGYEWEVVSQILENKNQEDIINSKKPSFLIGYNIFSREIDKDLSFKINIAINYDQSIKKFLNKLNTNCLDKDQINDWFESMNYTLLIDDLSKNGIPKLREIGYKNYMSLRVILLHASRLNNDFYQRIKTLYETEVREMNIPPGFLSSLIEDNYRKTNGVSLIGYLIKDPEIIKNKLLESNIEDLDLKNIPNQFVPIENCKKANKLREELFLPSLEESIILHNINNKIECIEDNGYNFRTQRSGHQ